MADRAVRWIGAGVLAAWLTTGALIGAASAVAGPDPADGGGVSSAPGETPSGTTVGGGAKRTDTEPNSASTSSIGTGRADDATTDADEPSTPRDATDTAGDDDETAPEVDVADAAAPDRGAPEDDLPTDVGADASDAVVHPVRTESEPAVAKSPDRIARMVEPASTATRPQPTVEPEAAAEVVPIAVPSDEPTPQPSTHAAVAVSDPPAPVTDATALRVVRVPEPTPPAPTGPTLANVIGTLFFTVFDFFNRLIEGPPAVPAGSTLRVGRSTLEIDCGDGYTADADWYFPTSGQPDKLIYFQHGFGARAGFYNLTAAELAERNNAIVVAPSITGNFFACDGCSLDGDQMHAAVAKLFLGDPVTGERTVLAASAAAAGYGGTLPERFVIAGHSEGGQVAAGSGGYFADHASAGRRDDLLGVLLFDTSATGGALGRALPKLDGISVLHVAGAPAPLNTFGNANTVLETLRPGQFNGVQLVGGTHSDAFRSSAVFGLAQVIVSLATGVSTPENVEAVQVLAQGWITDWFEGTRTDGFYGEPGSTITIDTAAGVARARVLPVEPAELSFVDRIVDAFLNSLQSLAPKPCAADPDGVFDDYVGLNSGRHSEANTALSLDGRRVTGQSVGQHECTG